MRMDDNGRPVRSGYAAFFWWLCWLCEIKKTKNRDADTEPRQRCTTHMITSLHNNHSFGRSAFGENIKHQSHCAQRLCCVCDWSLSRLKEPSINYCKGCHSQLLCTLSLLLLKGRQATPDTTGQDRGEKVRGERLKLQQLLLLLAAGVAGSRRNLFLKCTS